MSSSNNDEANFIQYMPNKERQRLCRILDQNDSWKELGGHMKFDVSTIQDIERLIPCGKSPSDQLLALWGRFNHQISELFVLLSRMQHYHAMEEIKHLVDPGLHRLITDGEQNLCRVFAQHGLRQSNGIIQPHVQGDHLSNSDNAAVATRSSKILNVQKRNLPNIIIQPNSIIGNNNMTSDENNENVVTPSNACPRKLSPQPQAKTTASGISDISSINETASAIPRLSYDELRAATDNWNDQNILGSGGFGKVFKGMWKNTAVAIKRLEPPRNMSSSEGYNTQIEQSLRELRYLNGCRHDNILSLYGYSMDDGCEPCLVYQYMPGGSLERNMDRARRNEQPALAWQQRKNIARGTARGLQFLHTMHEIPLIHGDIKAANILLDQCGEPRIGDFGLAREGPHPDLSHLTVTRIQGTRPYLPDEFLRGRKLSTKVDTYSFGIVLFEIATGLPVYNRNRKYKLLKDHVEEYCKEGKKDDLRDMKAEDAAICSPADVDGKIIFNELLTLGLSCVHTIPQSRPEMIRVLELLENHRIA